MNFNPYAAAVAGVVGFFIGGLWYSPKLFGAAWHRENGPHPHEAQGKHPASVFAVSIALSLVAAFLFAAWLGPNPALGDAVMRGAAVGAGFVATSFGINYQFAGRSMTLWAIDAGYHIAQFTLFGLVLGLWH